MKRLLSSAIALSFGLGVIGAAGAASAQPHPYHSYNHDNHGGHSYGHGGSHHNWRRGGHISHSDWARGRRVDWRRHHLRAPPRGYEWREVDGNYVLAAAATGLIAGLILNSQ